MFNKIEKIYRDLYVESKSETRNVIKERLIKKLVALTYMLQREPKISVNDSLLADVVNLIFYWLMVNGVSFSDFSFLLSRRLIEKYNMWMPRKVLYCDLFEEKDE